MRRPVTLAVLTGLLAGVYFVHEAMKGLKESGQAVGAELLAEADTDAFP